MIYYNKFKNFLSYLTFIFGIYIWILVVYSIFRYTGLIKASPLGNILLTPIEYIISAI